jgi:hypothetical protein
VFDEPCVHRPRGRWAQGPMRTGSGGLEEQVAPAGTTPALVVGITWVHTGKPITTD